MTLNFGADIPAHAYRELQEDLLHGRIANPEVQTVTAGLDGRASAYDDLGRFIRVEMSWMTRRPNTRPISNNAQSINLDTAQRSCAAPITSNLGS